MTVRDLIACALIPFSRRRTAAFQRLLAAEAGGRARLVPIPLEQFVQPWVPPGGSPEGAAGRLREQADQALESAARCGVEAIGWQDDRYPARLRTIPDPPPVLWVRGTLTGSPDPAVAVVGSRAATPYGLSVARHLGRDLASAGVLVVSGLARGCDGAAHQGALEAGGRTVAVVGCGPDIVYPREHRRLYDEVAASGAVLSELPPGTPPLPAHFPLRNRIISGLSAAVVVIEASSRSGSLITAACALEQGREVMAVPGNVLSERHTGCHELLRDGACLVQSARDVMEGLGLAERVPARPPEHRPAPADPLGILACLTPGEALDVDALAERAGLAAPDLLPELTRLELAGALQRLAGGRFVRPGR